MLRLLTALLLLAAPAPSLAATPTIRAMVLDLDLSTGSHGHWMKALLRQEAAGARVEVRHLAVAASVAGSIAALGQVSTDRPDLLLIGYGHPGYNADEYELLRRLSEAGTLIVAPSGNQAGTAMLYPGAYAPVLAVAAASKDGAPAPSSQINQSTKLMALAEDLDAPAGSGLAGTRSGSSFAAARVAGQACTLLAQGFSAREAVRRLLRTRRRGTTPGLGLSDPAAAGRPLAAAGTLPHGQAARRKGSRGILLFASDKAAQHPRGFGQALIAAGGRLRHQFGKRGAIADLPPGAEARLLREGWVRSARRDTLPETELESLEADEGLAARVWNLAFQGGLEAQGLEDNGEGAPLVGDALLRGQEANEAGPGTLLASQGLYTHAPPYGASFRDQSDFLAGRVAVGIFLAQANGEKEAVRSTWTPADLATAAAQIAAGADFWAQQSPNSRLSFVYQVHAPVPCGYEPILHPSSFNPTWTADLLNRLGYAGDAWSAAAAYNEGMRQSLDTDWALSVMVANDSGVPSSGGKFTDGLFGFAYLGGPYIVMTLTDDGWGLAEMDSVLSHEMGHIFWALDEYAGSTPASRYGGYLNVVNGNAVSGGLINDPQCTMRGVSIHGGYGHVCAYTAGQTGLRDQDGDGIPDVLDTFPLSTWSSTAPSSCLPGSVLAMGGSSLDQARVNLNPEFLTNGNGHGSITLNAVTRVQWRQGGGAWADASLSTAGDASQAAWTFTTAPILSDTLVEVRAVNSNGNTETSYLSRLILAGTATPSPTASPTPTPSPTAPGSFTASPTPGVNGLACGTLNCVAGTLGANGFSGDGGPATSALMGYNQSVAVGPAGDLYIVDSGNSRIRRVDHATGIITTVAGNGSTWTSGDGGLATAAGLAGPIGICIDTAGNLYVSTDARIRRVAAGTGIITTIAGTGVTSVSGDGGPATAATFYGVEGIAFRPPNLLYACDLSNHRVRVINLSTGIINPAAGNGTQGNGGDGLAATAATLRYPTDVAVAPNGDLIISETGDLRLVDHASGVISTIAGLGSSSGEGAPALSSKVAPRGVACDSQGAIFFSDSYTIRRLDPTTGTLNTVAGTGIQGYSGNGGPALSAQVSSSYGLAVGPDGTLYIPNQSYYHVWALSGCGAGGTATQTPGMTGTPTFTPTAPGTFTASPTPSPSWTPFSPACGMIDRAAGDAMGQAGYNGNGLPSALTLFSGIFGLAMAPDALLVADNGNGRLRRIDKASGLVSDLASGISPTDLARDPDGNLYYTQGNQVWKLAYGAGSAALFAGSAADTSGFGGDGGPASGMVFDAPHQLYASPDRKLYVADTGNWRVRCIDLVSGLASTLTGNAGRNWTGDNGPASAATFVSPWGLCGDPPRGFLYVSDPAANRVRRIDLATGLVSLVAGRRSWEWMPPAMSAGDFGFALDAQLDAPQRLACDAAGDLFILESGGRVRRVDAATGVITTVLGYGSLGYSGDGGPGVGAQIRPGGMAFDTATDRLYLAQDNRIRVFQACALALSTPLPTPTVTPLACAQLQILAGTGTAGYDFPAGAVPAATTKLNMPLSVAGDPWGGIVICDTYNAIVRRVDLATGLISIRAFDRGVCTVACPDGGQVAQTHSMNIRDLALDANGDHYVIDDQRIRRISYLDGIVTHFAGDSADAKGFAGDGGPASLAKFNAPVALAFDGKGGLFVADSVNHRVRRINMATGLISTFVGTGVPGWAGDGGPAGAAQLISPTGLACDASGNLYIADWLARCVRRVDAATGVISRVAGNYTPGNSGDGGNAFFAAVEAYTVALDPSGNLYIAGNQTPDWVRKVDAATGTIRTLAGSGGSGAITAGPALAAPLKGITRLAWACNQLVASSKGDSRVYALSTCLPPMSPTNSPSPSRTPTITPTPSATVTAPGTFTATATVTPHPCGGALNVCQMGGCDFSALGPAIAAACPGDSIHVWGGHYVEAGLVVAKPLLIIGHPGPALPEGDPIPRPIVEGLGGPSLAVMLGSAGQSVTLTGLCLANSGGYALLPLSSAAGTLLRLERMEFNGAGSGPGVLMAPANGKVSAFHSVWRDFGLTGTAEALLAQGDAACSGSLDLRYNTFISWRAMVLLRQVPAAPAFSEALVGNLFYNRGAAGPGGLGFQAASAQAAQQNAWQGFTVFYNGFLASPSDLPATNPCFADLPGGDFHITTLSPLWRYGTAVNSTDADFYGDTRDPLATGKWSVGAAEAFTPSTTPSPSASPSPSPSASRTPVASPTASPSRSPTPSASPSPSQSASPSAMASATASPSASASPTRSMTTTPSATPTVSGTPTLSPTPSLSHTHSATPSLSATPSISPTPSRSPTASASPTITLSQTPGAGSHGGGQVPPRVLRVRAVPNPLSRGRASIAVQMEGDADTYELKVYTKAMVCVGSFRLDQATGPGWALLPVDTTPWPAGLAYVVVIAHGNGAASRGIGKVMVLE